jgi:hypothetical protein
VRSTNPAFSHTHTHTQARRFLHTHACAHTHNTRSHNTHAHAHTHTLTQYSSHKGLIGPGLSPKIIRGEGCPSVEAWSVCLQHPGNSKFVEALRCSPPRLHKEVAETDILCWVNFRTAYRALLAKSPETTVESEQKPTPGTKLTTTSGVTAPSTGPSINVTTTEVTASGPSVDSTVKTTESNQITPGAPSTTRTSGDKAPPSRKEGLASAAVRVSQEEHYDMITSTTKSTTIRGSNCRRLHPPPGTSAEHGLLTLTQGESAQQETHS